MQREILMNKIKVALSNEYIKKYYKVGSNSCVTLIVKQFVACSLYYFKYCQIYKFMLTLLI